jgi:hypothetical protein
MATTLTDGLGLGLTVLGFNVGFAEVGEGLIGASDTGASVCAFSVGNNSDGMKLFTAEGWGVGTSLRTSNSAIVLFCGVSVGQGVTKSSISDPDNTSSCDALVGCWENTIGTASSHQSTPFCCNVVVSLIDGGLDNAAVGLGVLTYGFRVYFGSNGVVGLRYEFRVGFAVGEKIVV